MNIFVKKIFSILILNGVLFSTFVHGMEINRKDNFERNFAKKSQEFDRNFARKRQEFKRDFDRESKEFDQRMSKSQSFSAYDFILASVGCVGYFCILAIFFAAICAGIGTTCYIVIKKVKKIK